MARRVQAKLRADQDAYGQIYLALFEGREAQEIMERDDGLIYCGDPSDYFAPYRRWPATKKGTIYMIALSNRVHLFARPSSKEQLTEFFTTILGCEVLPTPVLAFAFSNGASLSVEFTEDALDEQQARRGAWLELKTDDAPALKQKILAAGLPRVEYPGNDYFYFQAPGGQVLRIASTEER
jgi:hypothetical protein